MTLEQQQIRQWMKCGQQEIPKFPSNQVPFATKELRLDLIAEELIELADAMDYEIEIKDGEVGTYFRNKTGFQLEQVADALADLMVVVLGTAVACGLDMEPLLAEVIRSNNTKLIKDANGKLTVIKNHHGKIMKPATYEPPNLVPIIEHQIANPLS